MPDFPVRVLFLPRGNEKAASSRMRIYNIVPHLSETDIRPVVLNPDFVLQKQGIHRYLYMGIFALRLIYHSLVADVVYIQKKVYPLPFRILFSLLPTRIIYDFDDALFTSGPHIDADGNEQGLLSMFNIADAVVAGGPALIEYADVHHENTYVIDLSLPKPKYQNWQDNDSTETITIGWIGNPENLYYLSQWISPLRDVLVTYDDVELLIISSVSFEINGLEYKVRFSEWSLESEVEYLKEADIAIRPLGKDEYAQRKGGPASILQCMALGIPVVTTPVVCTEELIDPGYNGLFADSADEWRYQLKSLIVSPELREEIGENARKTIEKGFFTEQRVTEYVDTIKDVYYPDS